MDVKKLQKYKILIAATGSVAAVKLTLLTNSVIHLGEDKTDVEVRVILTESAKYFIDFTNFPGNVSFYDDKAEWAWKKPGDPILHIELGKWADLMVIAPLDANTLAKMSQGLCDNLVTSTTRAWDLTKPLLFCPAMNTRMWNHPITSKQVATLKEWGYHEIPPTHKRLMCGETGIGAMASVETITQEINRYICQKYST